MTNATGSCLLFLYSPSLRGWEYKESSFDDEDFHRQMKEPGFRDYHLLLHEHAPE